MCIRDSSPVVDDIADEEAEPFVPVAVTFFADGDGDGFGDAASSRDEFTSVADGVVVQPLAPVGFVSDSSDCDDSDRGVNPGVAVDGVVPDGVDNNCDGSVDEDYVPVAEPPVVEPPVVEAAPAETPCLLYTSPSPRDLSTSRMPSSA